MQVRELQRVTGSIVKLPEESQSAPTGETPVHIIGQFYSVQVSLRIYYSIKLMLFLIFDVKLTYCLWLFILSLLSGESEP